MSYCRFGPDSDAYVVGSVDGHRCVSCRLMPEHGGMHDDYLATDACDMYEHLIEHQKAGHQINENAFLRLLGEMATDSLSEHYREKYAEVLHRLLGPSLGFQCLIQYSKAHQDFMDALNRLDELNWPED